MQNEFCYSTDLQIKAFQQTKDGCVNLKLSTWILVSDRNREKFSMSWTLMEEFRTNYSPAYYYLWQWEAICVENLKPHFPQNQFDLTLPSVWVSSQNQSGLSASEHWGPCRAAYLEGLSLWAQPLGAKLHHWIGTEGIPDFVLTHSKKPQGRVGLQFRGWNQYGLMPRVHTVETKQVIKATQGRWERESNIHPWETGSLQARNFHHM